MQGEGEVPVLQDLHSNHFHLLPSMGNPKVILYNCLANSYQILLQLLSNTKERKKKKRSPNQHSTLDTQLQPHLLLLIYCVIFSKSSFLIFRLNSKSIVVFHKVVKTNTTKCVYTTTTTTLGQLEVLIAAVAKNEVLFLLVFP